MMKRFLFVPLFVLSGVLVCSAQQTTFYFPHIADGNDGSGIWKTTIFISNPAAAGSPAVSGSVTLTTSQGGPLNIVFVDGEGNTVGAGNVIPFQVAGGQSRKFVSTGVTPLAVGFATVTANGPVSGTAVFSRFVGGRLFGEAGVPAASALPRQAIFVDTESGFDTGFAYANPSGSQTANITLRLLNTEAVEVRTTAVPLGPNRHDAKFVTQVFTGTPSVTGLSGTLQMISDAPIATIALRFDPTGLFTTLPPVSLASLLNPAIEWLQKRPWLSPLSSMARLLAGLQFRVG
jgi:hypothetical protein